MASENRFDLGEFGQGFAVQVETVVLEFNNLRGNLERKYRFVRKVEDPWQVEALAELKEGLSDLGFFC